jgi:phosphoribosylaminoimidazole carboxylase (NCAIR synthetase)
VKREEIDMVIPMFEEIACFAKALHRFPEFCPVFSSSYDTLNSLHNKWLFNQKLHDRGILAPKSYLIRHQDELKTASLEFPFVVKPCYCRSAQKVAKIETREALMDITVDPNNPLVIQEWLEGKKFCSYSIAHKGKLSAHTVYPLQFSINESSCLTFEAIDHPMIKTWVKTFVEQEKFTGQIGFDFIQLETDRLYPIECNPRSTSGLHLFQSTDHLPSAFFNECQTVVEPEMGFSKQIATGMLLYGWKQMSSENTFASFLKKFFSTQDVVFAKGDLAPFLMQPLLFLPYLKRFLKERMNIPSLHTFDADWNEDLHSFESL